MGDYVGACDRLLTRMSATGFDPAYPLEYGANGRLRGGAHRLSCALLLGVDVYAVTVPKDGTATWGEDWFRKHGISGEYMERIKDDFEWLRRR